MTEKFVNSTAVEFEAKQENIYKHCKKNDSG